MWQQLNICVIAAIATFLQKATYYQSKQKWTIGIYTSFYGNVVEVELPPDTKKKEQQNRKVYETLFDLLASMFGVRTTPMFQRIEPIQKEAVKIMKEVLRVNIPYDDSVEQFHDLREQNEQQGGVLVYAKAYFTKEKPAYLEFIQKLVELYTQKEKRTPDDVDFEKEKLITALEDKLTSLEPAVPLSQEDGRCLDNKDTLAFLNDEEHCHTKSPMRYFESRCRRHRDTKKKFGKVMNCSIQDEYCVPTDLKDKFNRCLEPTVYSKPWCRMFRDVNHGRLMLCDQKKELLKEIKEDLVSQIPSYFPQKNKGLDDVTLTRRVNKLYRQFVMPKVNSFESGKRPDLLVDDYLTEDDKKELEEFIETELKKAFPATHTRSAPPPPSMLENRLSENKSPEH